jgi:hypothetical protein
MERRINDIVNGGYGFEHVMIDSRIRKILHQLPESVAIDVLNDFEKALNRDNLRSPAAYLMGMLTRVQASIEVPIRGRIAGRLDMLYQAGFCSPDEVDSRCIDLLKQLPEEDALRAISELERVDRMAVKNISAVFMGIMRKYLPKEYEMQRDRDYIQSPKRSYRSNSTLAPPPKIIPQELLFGFGDMEYIPTMPQSRAV